MSSSHPLGLPWMRSTGEDPRRELEWKEQVSHPSHPWQYLKRQLNFLNNEAFVRMPPFRHGSFFFRIHLDSMWKDSGRQSEVGVASQQAGFGGKGQTGADRRPRITNFKSLPCEGVNRFMKYFWKYELMKMKCRWPLYFFIGELRGKKKVIWSVEIPEEELLSKVQHLVCRGFLCKDKILRTSQLTLVCLGKFSVQSSTDL